MIIFPWHQGKNIHGTIPISTCDDDVSTFRNGVLHHFYVCALFSATYSAMVFLPSRL